MKKITLNVNRQQHSVAVDLETPLLFVLTDELGLRGPRFGCGMAQCGACTVTMRGQLVRSCVMPVSAVGQDEITTLEGLARLKNLTQFSKPLLRRGPRNAVFASAA